MLKKTADLVPGGVDFDALVVVVVVLPKIGVLVMVMLMGMVMAVVVMVMRLNIKRETDLPSILVKWLPALSALLTYSRHTSGGGDRWLGKDSTLLSTYT